jgi:ABC-type branched-subunit amino acid transport system ATPase component
MVEPMLAVHDVEAGYIPTLPILHGISLEVFEGEIVTVLGPNGAGKSTLIKAIAGLLTVTRGSVMFGGRDITGLETHELIRERVAYVPQSENVFARLSVEENLALGALHNQSQFTEQRRRVLDLFPDLERLGHLAAGKLSGGQRQMVAVGRALMADPKLLMLDEPSAGLSPKLAQVVFSQLIRVKQVGVTILMVEQNARAALKISDRGYVLAEGLEKVQGDARSLLDNPEVGELYLGAKSRLARA